MFNLMGSGSVVWELLSQADVMTKFILLGLFLASVFCFSIVLYKYLFFKKELKALKELSRKARGVNKFDDFLSLNKEFRNTLAGEFLDRSLAELKKILQKNMNSASSDQNNFDKDSVAIDGEDLGLYDEILNQTIDQVLVDAEEYLPVLGTSAAASPLIGLFGTVWGLIHAFINISKEKSADIVAIAPGIAEALMTTLAGLIVAIPAMIFFHYFSNKIRVLEKILIGVSDQLLNNVRRSFLKK